MYLSRVACGQLATARNISYVIGELMYETTSGPFKFSFTVIAALCGIGLFVALVIVCVLVAYRRKSHESSQVMKRMQSQMDVLEIRVAKECKEGVCVCVAQVALLAIFSNVFRRRAENNILIAAIENRLIA